MERSELKKLFETHKTHENLPCARYCVKQIHHLFVRKPLNCGFLPIFLTRNRFAEGHIMITMYISQAVKNFFLNIFNSQLNTHFWLIPRHIPHVLFYKASLPLLFWSCILNSGVQMESNGKRTGSQETRLWLCMYIWLVARLCATYFTDNHVIRIFRRYTWTQILWIVGKKNMVTWYKFKVINIYASCLFLALKRNELNKANWIISVFPISKIHRRERRGVNSIFCLPKSYKF